MSHLDVWDEDDEKNRKLSLLLVYLCIIAFILGTIMFVLWKIKGII